MQTNKLPAELIFQIFTLLIAFIIVHGSYVALVRPQAQAFLAMEQEQLTQDPNYVQKRNFFVVIKDFEQEACFTLMIWAFAILGFKGANTYRQRNQLERDLLKLPPTLPIGPEDSHNILERLGSFTPAARSYILVRALKTGIQRFGVTGSIHDSATAVRNLCESEMERQESELSIIRYIAWAIPSIGFIGTVRGIGSALGQANRAVEGDITGVTQSLGVAFNSTFIALLISIVLMFFIHQLQLAQERLVLDVESYCDEHLISRLRVKPLG